MDLLSQQQIQTAGPSFSSSRVLRFSDLSQDEQENFVRFFAEQKVAFFRDIDGSYVANVRLYDPSVIDMSATNSTTAGTSRGKGSNKGNSKRDGAMGASGGLSSVLGDGMGGLGGIGGGLGLEYGVYSKFTALIAPRDTIKPKARPLSWLMRLIEEIYDQRYAKDTADLRGEAEAGGDDSGAAAGSTPFPQFVVDFFSKRYGLRSLIDQTCWDLLYNLHAARKEHLEAETFARFLEGHYDADDLLFYLYVRSVVQKELGVSFRSRWSELGRAGAEGGVSNSGSPAPLHLNVRECAIVSRVVFGSESDPLYRTFMAMLERHLIGKKPSSSASSASSNGSVTTTTAFGARGDSRKIEVTQFLHLALVEYHETRPQDDGEMASLAASTAAKTAAAAASSSRGNSPAGAGIGVRGSPSSANPYDDLAAAGFSSGSSNMSLASRSSPSGASGSEQLLREAEAAYAGRLQPASPPQAPAASSSGSSAGGGGIAAALLRKSPTFFDDLGEGMHQANERYLDKALSSTSAAAALPSEVQAQIRTEVQAQLEGKLDAILATTIKATQSGTSTGSAGRDALAAHFGRVMAAAAGEAPLTQDATIRSFCEAVLAQPEVHETVAPLVSLLVTYASARLQEATTTAGGATN